MTVLPDLQRSIRMGYAILAVLGSVLASLAVASFGAGRVTSTAERALGGKLDADRFVRDSTRRDAEERNRDELLHRIDRRVAAMYCHGKPPGCQ